MTLSGCLAHLHIPGLEWTLSNLLSLSAQQKGPAECGDPDSGADVPSLEALFFFPISSSAAGAEKI